MCECQKGRLGACVDWNCVLHVMANIQVVLPNDTGAREKITRIRWVLACGAQRTAVQSVSRCRGVAAVRAGLGEGEAEPGPRGHVACDVFCAGSACPREACDRVFRFVRAAYLAVGTHVAPRVGLVVM